MRYVIYYPIGDESSSNRLRAVMLLEWANEGRDVQPELDQLNRGLMPSQYWRLEGLPENMGFQS